MIADAIGRLTVDGTIDTSADPRAVDLVGTALAQRLDAYSVGALVCWDGNDEAALAQVVAADLGVPVIRAEESLGLLTLNHGSTAGTRVALVATRWGGYRPLEPLVGLEAVVAVSILSSEAGEHADLPAIVMERP